MLERFVKGKAFQIGVLLVVLLAAILIGVETDPEISARHADLLHLLDSIIIGIFVLEAVLKMAAHGRRFYRYFADPWNVFDFLIVVVCLLPLDAHYAAVLRLARVIRALRLITVLPRLQLLVGSLLRSLPSMGYIGLLLAILFYVYAVTGVFLWRDNDPVHFGDLPTALLSLFRVVTLEDWTDIMYTQMYGSDVYAFEMQVSEATNPSAAPLLSPLYFVSFVLLGTMIILNLFIGVILNSMDEAHRDQEAKSRARHMRKLGHVTVDDDIAELDRKINEARELLDRLGRRLKAEGRADEG
jgi:voltage-gated sodium channel